MAAEAQLSKADTKKAVNAFTKVVGETLQSGDKISLVGFGTFSVNDKEARTGRNPMTGEIIEIKAKRVAKFKVGAELAQRIK